MELELGVDILHYLKQFEEDGRDRGASKVSKIATMFQFSDEGAEPDERDAPCGLQAKVVRTESHVARFNTARALFEKMAERGGVSDKGALKATKQRRPSGGATKGRGTPSPSGGVELSRSPSPGSNIPIVQPNGHATHPYKSISSSSSIATISCSSSTPSNFPSSITNPSIPAVLPLSSKKFSDPSNSRWTPAMKTETHKSKKTLEEKHNTNKPEIKYKSEIKLTPDFAPKSFMKNGINSKFEVASKDILNSKSEHIMHSASKSNADTVDKPVKPAKPETLIDKSLSSHMQNQQMIQRHKNWFQTYSKNKSPSSTPSKSLSPSSSNNPTPEPRSPRDLDKTSSYENLFSKNRKSQYSEDELSPAKSPNMFGGEIQTHRNSLDGNISAGHNDWRKERAAILSGRSGRGTDDSTPSPSDPQKGKSFEEAPTLPSCWSPPKQYNIHTAKAPSQDALEAGSGSASIPDEAPSIRGNRGSKRSLTGVSAVQATEDRRRSVGEVSLRRRNEESNDREERLREWERRRSLREFDEAKVHGEVELQKREKEQKREEERRASRRKREESEIKKREESERKKVEEELERRKKEELERMRLVEEELKRKKREEELEREILERKREIEKKQMEEEIQRKRLEEERKRKEQEIEIKKKEEQERRKREELEKRKREEEEIERKKKEELERRKREELDRRKREEEEIERRKREKEELERRRREEEMERRRIEEEMKKKREEEIKRKKKEDAERKRIEEIERKRKEEEANERKRKEMEELKKKEEIERKKREEMERKKREEEKAELERKRKEEEELKRKREEEELERKRIEIERRKREKEEMERKKKEEEEERKRIELERRKREKEEIEQKKKEEEERMKKIEEELEKKRIFDELERRKEEEMLNRQRTEEQEKRRKEEEVRREELERKWQAKREKLEAEERERRERDRLEIERTKRRIAELKRERDEMQRQQAARLRKLMGEEANEEREQGRDEKDMNEGKRDKMERKEIVEEMKEIFDDKMEVKELYEERKEMTKERTEISEERKEMKEMTKERKEISEERTKERREMPKEMKEMPKVKEMTKERKEISEERKERNEKRKEVTKEMKKIIEERKEIKEERKLINEERKQINEEKKIIKEEMNEHNEIKEQEKVEISECITEMGIGVEKEYKYEVEETNKNINNEDVINVEVEERRDVINLGEKRGVINVGERRDVINLGEKRGVINVEERRDVINVEERRGSTEEVMYDHTVISAQHKLEFCTSPYNGSHPKDESRESSTTPTEPLFSSSTMSSSFEPLPPPDFDSLPPPIPPHNVDPATLAPKNLDSRLPPLPQEESRSCDPDVMTPDEEKKLLSHNIIGYRQGNDSHRLLSDVEAKEVCEILAETPEPDQKDNVVCEDVKDPANEQGDDPDGFDKDYDSVYVDSPTPDYEDSEFVFPGTQITEDGFVVRVKEVLIEDGVHYFEDGHFWIQVPGILEDDDEDIPDTVAIHKHTKIKFSKEPIKLFSTFSVTDYDRKNEDVDPVAASAEYELEKRVEKMDVFPVQIEKGDGGLGLSIIGMGVGADAGVEKLGIFVKTINPGGATDRDGRIRVNDQIIEVDNESLVGVTQVFAASVLKNTLGTVSFLIGRETDPENSEVAMLIRQSLMADQERDDRRRALEGPNFSPRGSFFESFSSQSGADSPSEEGHPTPFPQFKPPEMEEFGGLFPDTKSEFMGLYQVEKEEFGSRYQVENDEFMGRYPGDSDDFGGRYGDSKNEFGEPSPMDSEDFGGPYPGSGPTSPLGGVTSPPPEAFNHEVNAKGLLQTSEMIIMSQHLQEVQHRNEMYEEEINILRTKIGEVEKELGEKSELAEELRETTKKLKVVEDKLQSRQAEIATYQDMLEQSQGQYIILEKKYYKAKKIIKEYQSRERDFLHREEYHITQLEEKDALYNSLVKALKDRVIQLEGDLMNAQQQAGIPVKVPPHPPSNLFQSSAPEKEPPPQKEPPRKPSTISSMDADLSDNEGAETHTSEGSKSSTVERKVPSKEELDGAVPPTELLDNSFSKAKGELASRGGLANRQLPSLKKTSSTASAASLDKVLDDLDEVPADVIPPQSPQSPHSTSLTSQGSTIVTKVVHSSSQHEEVFHHSSTSTSTSTSYSNRPPPPYQQTSNHQHPPPYQPPPSAPLSHRPIVSPDTPHGGRGDSQYRHPPPIARVQPVNRVDPPSVTPTHQQQQQLQEQQQLQLQQQQQQSLANQLKALLAEREGNSEPTQRGNREGSPVKKSPTSLMEDVRQAVMQADMSIGKKPVISGPIHVSSTAQVVSTGQFVHNRTSPQKNPGLGVSLQQRISRDSGTWSPNLGPGAPPTSPSGGVVLLSQRPIEAASPGGQDEENALGNRSSALCTGDSNSSFDSLPQEKLSGKSPSLRDHSVREIVSVFDWTKEQVAQWLVVQGLENHVSTFVSAGITGPRLVNIDTKDLKSLGLSSDDKNKIKRKVKELRQNLEKERKQIEKENKEREKLQKKAEKLAEKAEKRKK